MQSNESQEQRVKCIAEHTPKTISGHFKSQNDPLRYDNIEGFLRLKVARESVCIYPKVTFIFVDTTATIDRGILSHIAVNDARSNEIDSKNRINVKHDSSFSMLCGRTI